MYVFFFKQKTAYEMRISDWSSDVCSSDLSKFMVTSIARSTDDSNSLRDSSPMPFCSLFATRTTRAPGTFCLNHDSRRIVSRAEASVTSLTSRSEEHTSELQSLMRISSAVFCLKQTPTYTNTQPT